MKQMEIGELLELIPLKENEKIILSKEMIDKQIESIKFFQNNAYINMASGKMIILKNINSTVYLLLKKIEKISHENILKNERVEKGKRVKNKEIEFI